MSDLPSETEYSEQETTDSVSGERNSFSDRDEYHYKGNFSPYQGEPLASSQHDSSEEINDDIDEDGLSPAVLKQRYERQIPVQEW